MRIFTTEPRACNIIEGRTARHQMFAASTPEEAENANAIQDEMFAKGFVRVFVNFRRHACPVCTSCKPSRVNIARFKSKNRLRDLKRINSDLKIRVDTHSDEISKHFLLYRHFKNHRFPGQESDVKREDFASLYFNRAAGNEIWGIYKNDRLICGIIFNRTAEALSSTQYYYDPTQMYRSLGMYATLLLIEEAKNKGLKYVYMGDLTNEPSPYNYKSKLSGIEVLTKDGWQPLHPDIIDQPGPANPACK